MVGAFTLIGTLFVFVLLLAVQVKNLSATIEHHNSSINSIKSVTGTDSDTTLPEQVNSLIETVAAQALLIAELNQTIEAQRELNDNASTLQANQTQQSLSEI